MTPSAVGQIVGYAQSDARLGEGGNNPAASRRCSQQDKSAPAAVHCCQLFVIHEVSYDRLSPNRSATRPSPSGPSACDFRGSPVP